MKIETIQFAGYGYWGILVNGMADTESCFFKTEREAIEWAKEIYPGHKIVTTSDPEHYSNET